MSIEEVRLTDLISTDTLQIVQNSFSKMARMAALTTDENGIPLTEGSSFSDFCANYCRKSPIGRKRCEKCDREGAMRALQTGQPASYFCHANLVDFAAPIMLGDRMIGCFVGGQVLSEEPDYDRMREIARELELDEEEFVNAAKNTQIVPQAAIERATNFIFEFSRVISDMAYKTFETIRLSNLAVSQKSDFLANMSHEIRTPMNAVLGMAEMALREEMTPQAKQYIRQIRSSGKHLLVIINDILDFSKIESGKLDIVKVDYEPLSMVNDLVSVVNTRIGSKKLEFTIDYEPTVPQKLHGDNVRIHQILLNVLNNAVKFTESGEVHLAVSSERIDSETVTLKAVISDTGIGIKSDDMGKLFQSFQQVDSKRNRNIEGTGLGLAISKQLLKLMNGSISVESEYEKGSRFTVEIPQKVISWQPSVPETDIPGKLCVFVRDEYVHRQLCRDLSALGIEYTDVESGEQLRSVKSGCVITERKLYSDIVQQVTLSNPELECMVIVKFDETIDTSGTNVRILRKPVFSAGLSSALRHGSDIPSADSKEVESFVFTAPEAHVLIVDDNPINLTVACGIIEPLGMQVDTANGASETIEKVKKMKYDIIFMDHMMPEVDGVETTHIIRRLIGGYESVPIIALTANAMDGTREMFLREGMNDFIAKPIEVSEIVAMVRKWLPAEKIVPVKMTGTAPAGAEEQSRLEIPGLNTQQAVAMLGSEKLYIQILRDYYQSVDKRISAIREAADCGDIKAYTIEVHSLKSISRQIGAEALADLAARLEKAGNARDVQYIAAHTEKLIADFLRCKELIAPQFPELSGKREEPAEDYEAVYPLLADASDALSAGDMPALNSALDRLSECVLTPAQSQCLNKLRQSAGSVDNAVCSTVLEMWKQIADAENGKKLCTTDDIIAGLEKMQEALESYDSLIIDQAMADFEELIIPQEQQELREKLKEAAEESDVDLCASIIEEWKNMLGLV